MMKEMNEKKAYAAWKRKLKKISRQPVVPRANPSGIIVLDTETTGLDPFGERDEMLQLSIIDGDGNTLLDTYIKPKWHDVWPGAESVNGISPEMVKDAPSPEELVPAVKGIFESADVLVGYNVNFDLAFLSVWGICLEERQVVVDVMQEFAEVYGEWNDYFESYKWQKLTTAAQYYGFRFQAHNSLEDARATLYVYKAMRKHKEED